MAGGLILYLAYLYFTGQFVKKSDVGRCELGFVWSGEADLRTQAPYRLELGR